VEECVPPATIAAARKQGAMRRMESPSERHRVRVLEQERPTGTEREPRLEDGTLGVQAVVEDQVEVLTVPAVVAEPRVEGEQVRRAGVLDGEGGGAKLPG
jgi:hypothetical protein